MIKEYSEYSGLSEEVISQRVIDFNQIIKMDLDTLGHLRTIVESENLIYENLKYQFESDDQTLVNKYLLFSPQFLHLTLNSNYTSFLEFMGGLGTLSQLIKKYSPQMRVDYCSMNNHISNFAKWRFDKNKIDINVTSDIVTKFDVIVCDGIIHYLERGEQISLLYHVVNRVNRNGLLALLIDISGPSETNVLKQEVDILYLHEILEQSDMVCIYGKNTFSSLWKKMI